MIQPQIFGKFILLERVSVGGMAEVYRAKLLNTPNMDRFFAIKRILPHLAANKEFVTMFINEAKVAVELEHPNVCQIFELGRLGQSHYIAMEYIAGRDVQAIQNYYRQQKKIMSVSQACFIIAQAAQGLDYAHRAVDSSGQPLGLVHRDVSPQNLLVTYDGVVKLIDFGVSKASRKTTSHSASGVIKGKFSYLSPEQAREAEIDHRSDIFALGIIFWELLTGRRLFQAESELALIEMIGECHIEKPSKYNRMIPDAVEKICMKALEKDVNKRYSWASEMVTDLLEFISSNKTPFTQWHLQNWMCATFKESFEAEWEKIPIFNTLNTPEDIDIYISKHAEEIASSLSIPNSKPVSKPAKRDDSISEKDTVPKVSETVELPKRSETEILPRQSETEQLPVADSITQIPGVKPVILNGVENKSENPSLSINANKLENSDEMELVPEGIAPEVDDPQVIRFRREERKAKQRKSLVALIVAICVCFIVSPVLFLSGVVELPKPEVHLPTSAAVTLSIVPESPDAQIFLRSCGETDCMGKDLPLIKTAKGIQVQFDNLEAGSYRIDATMPNYKPESFTIKLENGSSETRIEMTQAIPQETEYHVHVIPEDAQLYLNDEPVPGTGSDRIMKGLIGMTYSLKAFKPGFESKTITGNLEQNAEITLELTDALPVSIALQSYPSRSMATLFVDGKPMKRTETPVVFNNLNTSQPTSIEVVKQGFVTYKKEIDFKTYETNEIKLFADLKAP